MERPIVAVRIIFQDEKGRILFLKRKNTKDAGGMWCLPGGSIEFKETAEQACIREIKEEVGLNTSNIEFLFYFDILPIEDQTRKHGISLVFKANFSGEIRLNKEHSEYSWIPPKDIDKYPIAFNHNKIIERLLSGS